MALSGSLLCTPTNYNNRKLSFSWTGTQSISGNYTRVTWTLTVGGVPSPSYSRAGPITVKINGSKVLELTSRKDIYNGDSWSGTITIYHNVSGVGNLTLDLDAAIYYTSVNTYGDKTWALNTIPRTPSTIDITYHQYSSGSNAGYISYSITQPTAGVSHTIVMTCNGVTLSKSGDYYIVPASAMPDSVSETVTAKLTTTISGVTLGTDTDTCTATLPSYFVPTITNLTASVTSNLYKNQTNTTITINGGTVGEGASGTLNYHLWSSNVSDVNSSSYVYNCSHVGTNTFYGYVTDARGRQSTTKSVTFTVNNYEFPTLINLQTQRCDSSGVLDEQGTYCFITPTYSNGVNAGTISYYYSLDNGVNWTTISIENGESSGALGTGGPFSIDEEYTVKFKITWTDLTADELIISAILHSSEFLMDFVEDGVAFGGSAESGKFKCGLDAHFADASGVLSSLFDLIHPVNSLYISMDGVNPATIFGGTWTRLSGRFLWAENDDNVLGDLYGSSSHTHTTGGHTLTTSELPSHRHSVSITTESSGSHYHGVRYKGIAGGGAWVALRRNSSADSYDGTDGDSALTAGAHTHSVSGNTGYYGSGGSHSHGDTGSAELYPPLIKVAIWQRTA